MCLSENEPMKLIMIDGSVDDSDKIVVISGD